VADGVLIYAFRGAKWKAGLQMVATGLLLLNHDPFGLPIEALGSILLWAAALVTLWTGYTYFAAYFRQVAAGPGAATPAPPPQTRDDSNEDV
jgi:phosphatidylglycerophosphate synthase